MFTDSHTATVENIENNHKYLIILLQGGNRSI